MALQYVGLSEINGPLVVLDHVKDASYDEMVELQLKRWFNTFWSYCRN